VIEELTLSSFRCFSRLTVRPAPGLNYFVGPNAVGKTSLLEALCVVLRLQSPRSHALQQVRQLGSDGFSVRAHWRAEEEPPTVPVVMDMTWTPRGRRLALDSVPQSKSSAYLQHGRVTWFGNEDLELVRGSGSARRRFLDFLGSQLRPDYVSLLRGYERALKARNFLLREGRSGAELDAYTAECVRFGEPLGQARAEILPALRPVFLEAVRAIGGRDEAPDLVFHPGCEGNLEAALSASRERDRALRQTSKGPHRDDFTLTLHGQKAADFGSEGQQRTLVLALKLAQARLLHLRHGRYPILLLDDVFGELDPLRRNLLLQALPLEAQTFITTTFLDWNNSPLGTNTVFSLPLADSPGSEPRELWPRES
jgi:DNA replication and repair protein RecF